MNKYHSYQHQPQQYPYSSSLPTSSIPSIPSPKSRWTLLTEFQQLPEDEIEGFLPQICSMLIEREPNEDPSLYEQFERIVIDKCSGCLPFGMRVCNLLKATKLSSSSSSSDLLRHVLNNPQTSYRDERIRIFQEHAEYVTSQGVNLPSRLSSLRAIYYRDLNFMLDTLARLGTELRAYPIAQRNFHLKNAMSQLNSLLFTRMVTRGQVNADSPITGQQLSAEQVASCCPSAAAFSLHLPLQHCREKTLRILRFVDAECEVLPSKERCPYLVVAELLEQPFSCKSDELFTQGHAVGVTVEDIISGKTITGLRQSPSTHVQYSSNTLLEDAPVHEIDTSTLETSAPSNENVNLFARNDIDSNIDSSIDSNIDSSLSENIDSTVDNDSNISIEVDKLSRLNDDIRGGHVSMPNYDSNSNQYYNGGAQYPSYPNPPVYDSNPNYNNGPQGPQQVNSNYNYNSGNGYESPYSPQGMVMQGNGQIANIMRKTFVKSQTWEEKTALIKSSSVFGHLEGWKLKSFIVKAGDDLRKEILAMQIIEYCQEIFKAENIDIILRPYQIICTSHQAGLVEFIETARSIDRIKKSSPDVPTLKEFYEFSYGPSYSLPHAQAVQNFVKSLVGYSLITYLLQVKDRHNANLLIDRDGSIIHIDFGFIMGESPGFNINFENAPFKLTREYIEVMGGIDSAAFKSFEDLFLRGFYALKKHVDGLSAVVQLFYGDRKKDSANQLRSRLDFASSPSEILMLVRDSADNWRTKQYDWFQQRTNNILM